MNTITIERNNLSQALDACSKAMSPKNTLPVLGHVRMQSTGDGIQFTGTDLDTSVRYLAPVISVLGDIDVCLPAVTLSKHAALLADAPVTFELDDLRALIRSGKSRFNLTGCPGDDYPELPGINEASTATFTIPALTLRDMLRMTVFSASDEESRSILNGVLFQTGTDKLTLVATDTHRLAKREEAVPGLKPGTEVIIPSKVLSQLMSMLKSGDVTVSFDGSRAQFRIERMEFACRILDGQFPNYEKVIPKTAERVATVRRQEWLQALKRCVVVAQSQKVLVRLEGEILALSSEDEAGTRQEDEVAVSYDGDKFAGAFNASYLVEVLTTMTSEVVKLSLNGPLNPGILESAGDADGFTYVVMPMQA